MIALNSYHHLACFEAGIQFTNVEGILPAPEANHAVRGAIDEALRCKSEGKSQTVAFNLCSHGHFDMHTYMDYFASKLTDQDYDQQELAMVLAGLPFVKAAKATRQYQRASGPRPVASLGLPRTAMLKTILLVIFVAWVNSAVSASELILEHTAIEKTLKRDVFNANGGRYHLVDSTTCAYTYLESPQVSIATGRLRIKSHFISQVASQVGGECVGTSDEFDITVSGRPVYRNDKLVMDDVRLDDATNPVWRPLIEVFIKSAGPRVLELNLKEALQRMFKDASTPYDVTVEKIRVTKLSAEENKIKATFDFILQAR